MPTLEDLNTLNPKTIHEALGIRFTDVGEDFLEATMPVDERTHNPIGTLHGGASVVLAETLGSVATTLVVGPTENIALGLEINASHLSSIRQGIVVGRATPIRIGKSHQVWDIQIFGDDGKKRKKISQARLTTLVLKAHFDK